MNLIGHVHSPILDIQQFLQLIHFLANFHLNLKQMRIVQEIASLLGETAAETKIALSKLKESITNE